MQKRLLLLMAMVVVGVAAPCEVALAHAGTDHARASRAHTGHHRSHHTSIADRLRYGSRDGDRVHTGTPAAAPGQATGALMLPGTRLGPGQALTSPNGQYVFGMQPDGNLVLRARSGAVLWSSQTERNPGARAEMQLAGNLVVYSPSNQVLFATSAGGRPFSGLLVQNDGDVVLYAPDLTPMWSTQLGVDHLAANQTLYPGQSRSSTNGRFKLLMQDDGNLVLYRTATQTPLWASHSFSPGATALLQTDGNLTLRSPAGAPVWATGTKGGGYLLVQNDGNLVLYSAAQRPLWSSNTRG